MKKIILFSLIVATNLLSVNLYAQTGWLWGRGNTGGFNDAWGVAADPSGNVWAAGIAGFGGSNTFGSYTVPTTGVSGYQTVMVKYGPAGNFLWAIGTLNGGAWLMNITADQWGNSYIFGTITSASVQIGTVTLANPRYPKNEYFIAKLDPAGNVVWAKADGESPVYGGSSGPVYLLSAGGICTDDTGNVYITTSFLSDTITVGSNMLLKTKGSSSYADILVAKYDSLGNVVWATGIGDTLDDRGFSVTATHAGNVYISGATTSGSLRFGDTVIINPAKSTQIAYIGELNSSGVPIWAHGFGRSSNTGAAGVASDIDNNVYLTGGTRDTTINFGSAIVTNPTPGRTSLYLVKYKPNNTIDWTKTIYGTASNGTCWGFCIAMSPCGAIWVSGNMSTGTNLNVDGNILAPPANSYDPVFIAGYTAAGTVAGYAALASGADDQNGIACDYSGNVYMCADYITGVHGFNVGPSTFPDCTNSEWLYVGKYASVNTGGYDTTIRGRDTIVCTLDTAFHPVTLNAPPGYKIYKWGDTNYNGRTRVVNKPGKYWVLSVGNCSTPTTVDTFRVTFGQQIVFHLDNDTLKNKAVSCNKRVILKAPEVLPGVTYLWTDGKTTQLDTAVHSGQYAVTITKGVCSYTDTMTVDIYYLKAVLRDTFLCKELAISVPLYVDPPPGANVMWSTGSTAPTVTLTDTGAYWVHITQGPCKAYDTMRLTHEFCDCWSQAPSGFTPNGDGRNDLFKPIVQPDCPIKEYFFSVYNRYGQRVFYSASTKSGWDGAVNGVPADIGTYFWEMEYYGGVNKNKHYLKGDVTLIR